LGERGAARRASWHRPRHGAEDHRLPTGARAVHVGRRARRNPRHRPGTDRQPPRPRRAVTDRVAPVHVGVASLCLGLAAANLERVPASSVLAALALVAALALWSPESRLAGIAVLAAALGWWWGSARLDRIDRSPLSSLVGRAGRATIVVTSQPRAGRLEVRATGTLRRFTTRSIHGPVQLELPLGRAPPAGAIIDALVVIKQPRGPSHGFDERTWLRRHGIHVVARVDAWREIGRRG